MQNQNAMFWTKSMICILAMFFTFCMMIFVMEIKRDETEKIVDVVINWFKSENLEQNTRNESNNVANKASEMKIVNKTESKKKRPTTPAVQAQPRILIIGSNVMQAEQKPMQPLTPFLNDNFIQNSFDSDLKRISKMQFNPFSNDLFTPKKFLDSEPNFIPPMNPFQNQIIIRSQVLQPKLLQKEEKQNDILSELPKPTHIRCILCMKKMPLGENCECPHKKSPSPFINRLLSIIRPVIKAKKEKENKHKHHEHHHKKEQCLCSEELENQFKHNKYDNTKDRFEDFLDGKFENKKFKNDFEEKCDCSFCQDMNLVESRENHHDEHHGNQKFKNYRSNSWSRRNFSY